MTAGLVLSFALAATNISSCGCEAAPSCVVTGGCCSAVTIRHFERRDEDNQRRQAWEAYCEELDQLWKEFRAARSTPEAWQRYRKAAAAARSRYVFQDPYLVPVID